MKRKRINITMEDKLIIKYAKCCVNLYAVVSTKDIITVIKHYEGIKIDTLKLIALLDNTISKSTQIQKSDGLYYKFDIMCDSDIKAFYQDVKKMPLFLPNKKSEFFKYIVSTYCEAIDPPCSTMAVTLAHMYNSPLTKELLTFTYKLVDGMFNNFRSNVPADYIIDTLLENYPQFKITTANEKHVLIDLAEDIAYNTRLYDFRGFTPFELEQVE